MSFAVPPLGDHHSMPARSEPAPSRSAGSRCSRGVIRPARLGFVASLTVVIAVAISTLLASPASAQGAQEAQIDLGATAFLTPDRTLIQSVAELEANTGRRMDVVRVFLLWDSPMPWSEINALRNGGRKIFLSVRASTVAGQPVLWRDLADAPVGSPRHRQMVQWATRVRNIGDDVFFTFHHEPETIGSIPNGSDAEFIRAWRRMHTLFGVEGVRNAEYVWTMTDFSFVVPTTDRRSAPKWYPGDAFVDHFAADGYNWHTCRANINNQWKTLEAAISDFVAFGAAHPDKGLMLAEVASVEDANDPQRKARWINEVQALMKRPAYSQFNLLAWYEHPQPGEPGCEWYTDTSPASLAAWRQLANDPFFGGGGNLGSTDPVPSCSVAAQGDGSALLRWTAEPDGIGYVFYRDGQWLHRIENSATVSYRDPRPPSGVVHHWSIAVLKADRTQTARTYCGSATVTTPARPPSACFLTVQGDQTVRLNWNRDFGGVGYVLYRNGFWLGRVNGQTNTVFVDQNPPLNVRHTWFVATIGTDNSRTEATKCGTATVSPGGTVAAPAACYTVARADGSVEVNWTPSPNSIGYVVERNGFWLARVNDPAADRFVDANPPTTRSHTWQVRAIRADNTRTAATGCGGGGIGAPATCSVSRAANGAVRVSWGQVQGASAYVIFRNGFWAGRADGVNTLSKLDTNPPTGRTHTWTVKARTTNGTFSTASNCGSLTL